MLADSMKTPDWEKILPKFQLPGRYSGGEYSAYPNRENTIKFLLAFPDDYSIGMSSLGFHTVGNIVNLQPGFSCERVFAPAIDMEEWLRKENYPLFSLESKRPAGSFDIIGFSMQYELSFTNFINMLELSKIEPRREDRQDCPLIMGGGPSFANPAALSAFFDIIILGEAEPVLPEVLSLYQKEKNDRNSFLLNAAAIEGVFVPGISKTARYAIFKEFDNTYFPVSPPQALTESAHARINLEINRGCRNRCRFCQASVIYSPYREKTVEKLMEVASASVASTGYDEISLTSLSGTDHTEIIRLLDELHYSFRSLGVSAVMSSMRPSHFASGLAARMARMRKGGITLAPETPSKKLQKVIGKNISSEEIISAAVEAARLGWKRIKLYFMIGLPGEDAEDIESIISFISLVKKSSGLTVSASISPLVPQPHTPFQWVSAQDPDQLLQKAEYIRKKAPAKVSRFNKGQHIIVSILSRADASLSELLLAARKRGARFDQWSEHFNFEIWEEAFRDIGSSWEEYYFREYKTSEVLPWDNVVLEVGRESLLKAYQKAMEA
ncbi:MAG: radical SAM protein [Elusimicrobia bacterium]|nr:radical SAM protein [Elusimicrobiota bacterium]